MGIRGQYLNKLAPAKNVLNYLRYEKYWLAKPIPSICNIFFPLLPGGPLCLIIIPWHSIGRDQIKADGRTASNNN